MAGSFAIACRSSAKLPVACFRIVSCWRYMRYGDRTFCRLVAKWSCQNQTSRSSISRGLDRICCNHHSMGCTICWIWRAS